MREFFKEYKKQILNHPKAEYKPTSLKFDADILFSAYKEVEKEAPFTEQDVDMISDFVEISQYHHGLFKKLYSILDEDSCLLNIKGYEIAQYLVSLFNQQYKVALEKWQDSLGLEEGSYLYDIMNPKIETINPSIGPINLRASLETTTDSLSLLLNYLRTRLDDRFESPDSNANQFAGVLLHMLTCAATCVAFKYSYDDTLYNDGFTIINKANKTVVFDYENHDDLKLLLAGDMMFTERRKDILSSSPDMASRFHKNINYCRIQKTRVIDNNIELEICPGEAYEHKIIADGIQVSIDSFYEFLDGNTILTKFAGAKIDEAISVYIALHYIFAHISLKENYDVSLYKKDDFRGIPCKIKKDHLINYLGELTTIEKNKIEKVVDAIVADWSVYNDIWSSPLYQIIDYYLIPFFPLLHTSIYNLIDQLLKKGGFNLEARGKQFENYLFESLKKKQPSYPIICLPAGKYGKNEDRAEIDFVISMKKIILVGEAKCIHYSVEPKNYSVAWDRLKKGCQQAKDKVQFIKNHPELFQKLGEFSNKEFVPFVITNYPTFTGFCHDGVYIVDSHSFIKYIIDGTINIPKLFTKGSSISIKLYNSEDQFSDNFKNFLAHNPIKEEFMKGITIEDLHLMPEMDGWNIISKSAQRQNDNMRIIRNG